MNFFSDMMPMRELPPKMRGKSHFTVEPWGRDEWLMTIHRKVEAPNVKVLPSYAAVNRERMKLDGFLSFVRGV